MMSLSKELGVKTSTYIFEADTVQLVTQINILFSIFLNTVKAQLKAKYLSPIPKNI